MKLGFPRAGSAVVAGAPAPFAAAWQRWLNALHASLGFAQSDVYSEILGSIDDHAAVLGNYTVTKTINVKTFPAGSTVGVDFVLRLPNNYRDGTDVTPFIEWIPSDTAPGLTLWKVRYSIGIISSAMTTGVSLSAGSTAPEVGAQVVRVVLESIDGTSLTKGAVLLGRLERLGANVLDTYSGEAGILSIGAKYLVEGIGDGTAHP